MYKTASDTEEYLKAITKATADLSRSDYQFFFIPSYTALERASKSPVRDSFMLGAQNMCWEAEGQFTGEISPVMLRLTQKMGELFYNSSPSFFPMYATLFPLDFRLYFR